jgi:hypothetical protein
VALPPEVLQGLGWLPPQSGSLTGGPLPPVPEQAPLGLPMPEPQLQPPPVAGGPQAEPPPSLPELPPPPKTLDLQPPAVVPAPAAPSPDFVVAPPVAPVPAPASAPQRQAKPQTPDQQLAGVQQRQNETDQSGLNAIKANTDADRQQAASELLNYEAHDAAAKKIADERAAWEAERAKTYAQKQAYVDASAKEIDDFKLDRDKYWKDAGVGDKIGWGVGMALSGLGNAFLGINNPSQGSAPNPVIQMLQNKMHESVVAQMDQRDQLKEKNTRAEHALDRYDAFSKDRSAQIALKDANNDKALAGQLLMTAAKSRDQKIMANAQTEAAKLMQSSTDKYQKAVEFAAGYDIQKKQVAVSQAQAATAAGHLQLQRDTYNQEYGPNGLKQQALDLKAAEEGRKASADKKKAVKETGVFDPTTGKGLHTEAGNRMLSMADQLEARAQQNPAIAPAAMAKAQELRKQANEEEVVTLNDPVDRRKVVDGLAKAQELTDTLGEMKAFLNSDPDITNREGWASLKTKLGGAIGGYAEFIGARASSPEFKALTSHVLDYDPDSIYDRALRTSPGAASVDALMGSIKNGVDKTLKARGITDGWTPSSLLDQPTLKPTGETAAEISDNQQPGRVATGFWDLVRPIPGLRGGPTLIEQDKIRANESALSDTINKTGVSSGLAPDDVKATQSLVNQASAAGAKKREQIVLQLADTVISNFEARPSLTSGILNLVRDQDPGVYQDILSKMTPAQADARRRTDAARVPFPSPETQVRSQSSP